jgi:hypothetical protein
MSGTSEKPTERPIRYAVIEQCSQCRDYQLVGSGTNPNNVCFNAKWRNMGFPYREFPRVVYDGTGPHPHSRRPPEWCPLPVFESQESDQGED